MKMKNIFYHFCLINQHKWYVFKNCLIAGIPIRGVLHDLSKFSPTEFFESAKYYNGACSPIDMCKKINGYSKAWLHHKGRNKHHYEYWQDNFDNGGVPLRMPYKYALELVCDYLGAGQAYNKIKRNKKFYEIEYDWWTDKKMKPLAMHKHTMAFVEVMLYTMKKEGSNDCLRPKRSRYIYRNVYSLLEEVIYLD